MNKRGLLLLLLLVVPVFAADDARPFDKLRAVPSEVEGRGIVEEAQKRTEAKSQRYEGLLRVIDAKGKVADKRWIYMRIGSHGTSKSLLRFTDPAEVKGVTLLVVNHPDSASDQWM